MDNEVKEKDIVVKVEDEAKPLIEIETKEINKVKTLYKKTQPIN